jgi:hypothetical protein
MMFPVDLKIPAALFYFCSKIRYDFPLFLLIVCKGTQTRDFHLGIFFHLKTSQNPTNNAFKIVPNWPYYSTLKAILVDGLDESSEYAGCGTPCKF